MLRLIATADTALNELGRLDEALGSLNIAASLAPNAPVVWYNKANVHFQKKDYHSALDGYGRAVEIDPNYSDGWLGRGNAFAALERYDEAVAAYNRVLTLKPDLVTAWLASASIFYAIRRYDDALVAYDKVTQNQMGLSGSMARPCQHLYRNQTI